MASGDDFSTLFELLPIGAYRTAPDGRQLRVNQAMARIFGFANEAEMLTSSRVNAGGWYADPGARQEFRRRLEADGAVRDLVSEMRREGSGEVFWISENAHLVRSEAGAILYYEGTVEDITERKRAEDELRVTVQNVEQGLMRFDAQGRVVFHTQRALDMLNLPPEWLARRPTLQELTRWQAERGDFGDGNQLLESPTARTEFDLVMTASDITGSSSYIRKTHDGRVLEVKTRALPEGGAVRTYSDVTAYFNAQQDLAQKSRMLQITLDSMSQGIATIDATGRVVLSNRRHQELLNLPEGLMASQPTMEELVRFQIDRGDFGKNFDFVDAVARGYVAVGDKLPAIQGPETYMRKSREGKTLEVRTRPLPDGGVVRTFTDMTDYVQAQEALARKEAQLRALVGNIPDRVWLKDARGVYQLSNPAHWRNYGLREEDVVGRTARELFGDEVAEHQRRTDERAMASDQPLVYEEQLTSLADGRLQYVELVKVAMRDESGQCIGLLGIARDITARKEAEAALISAKEAAEAGNRAKADFLANMSHEIRTPMNAVIGMSDLLLDTPLTGTQREFAETIRTSGDALLALINDILDFSKIESGHLELESVPVNLTECVESALDLTSGPAVAKGLDLLYWIEDGVPRAIYGDMTRLRQVLINLVNNAVKFTKSGEVVVTLSRREAADGSALLHGSVRDTGIGIPADRLNRLFQVFSQVDTSTTRQYGGTGLGLAICRRLIALMGGHIWVDSVEGQGSDFQFDIPCHAVPSGPSAYVNRKAVSLSGRRVLLVDDNATNRQILTLQTSRWGMLPRAASSGRQALDWLDAGDTFDAALIDVQMPGMDGYALAAELRKRFPPARLPLLVLTSLGDAGQQLAGLGVAQTLMKPTKSQVLFDALTALFERPAAALPAGPAGSPAPADAGEPRLAQQVPLRLLLAEDNLVNQRVAALILGGLGYDIQIVDNGQAALDAVAVAHQQGAPFDVVLMDVQMPGMDGLEASRQLCAQYPPTGRPWITAMTANAMEGDRDDCLAAGMDDYLSKPIRAAAVGDALRRAAAGLAARRV
ncbi:MAG: PAS-domain containing protein [Ramlibacter sp.]|nr:PAS-domain containing protein [Ramlibacter sp.]